MKIRILRDAHHRVSSGLSIAYRAGTEPNVPRQIAGDLIARGVAEAVQPNPSKGDDRDGNG